jgi:hypothetical protein
VIDMPEPTPAEEETILTRAGIRIVLGGHAKFVAPLTIDRNREWKKGLADTVGVAFGSLASSAADWKKLVSTVAGTTDQQVDLLVAYDEAGSLGGREWIGAHATEREVWDGLRAVLDEAFPQIAELLRKVPPAILLPTVLQLLESSTSSPSPAGPPFAAPKNSKLRSPRASSRS